MSPPVIDHVVLPHAQPLRDLDSADDIIDPYGLLALLSHLILHGSANRSRQTYVRHSAFLTDQVELVLRRENHSGQGGPCPRRSCAR